MVFKDIFEFIFRIEPATGNWLIDLLLPGTLSLAFYQIAYNLVGEAYDCGIISGSRAGSALHWFIRCGIVYFVILVFNAFITYWYIFLSIAIIAGVILVIFIIKRRKSH